jgi:hypothetical protein
MTKPTSITLVFACLSITAVNASAQVITVPEPGAPPGAVTTIGLDGTVDKFYTGSYTAIVKAADGTRHIVHFFKGTSVHGAKEAEHETFAGLKEGSTVVVHYAVEGEQKTAIEVDHVGDGGLSLLDGTVRHIDRGAKTLTIDLADGTTATLRLTERAARNVGKGIGSADRVIVYYADESGERVAHFFRLAK